MPWTVEVPEMAGTASARMTAPRVAARKGSDVPLVMVTAYDAPTARTVDAAGADLILVGDTLAMVVLGYDDTLQVTTDEMAHHVGAVARTKPNALVVGDLPWLSYHVSTQETVHNAARLIRAGAGAVKLEGGRKRLGAIQAILDAEIPVMGHIGLTPQSIHAMGGFKVQGKELDAAKTLADDAVALADAGCFAIVLECVPDGVARIITEAIGVPTIGIGAGRHCDGQVLVWHDMLGFSGHGTPHAEVRARVRVARSRRDRRDRALLRRRARGHVSVERGDVPHDRPDGSRARSLRWRRPNRSLRNSARVIAAAVVAIAALIGMVVLGARVFGGDGAASLRFAKTEQVPAGAFDEFRQARVALGDKCVRVLVAATRARCATRAFVTCDDLAPYDGMIFVFAGDTNAQFTMAQTPMPLDITWYDAQGAPVDHTTMIPCPNGTDATCPAYTSKHRYRYALERPAGSGGGGALGSCAA